MSEQYYRAYHKEHGMIFPEEYFSLADAINGDLLFFGSPAKDFDLDDFVFMSFTGLLDKNGKEIYEGDIVLRYGKHRFVVEWNNDFCGFKPFCEHRNNYGLPDVAENSSLTEIIGNIYEHPDLLLRKSGL